MYILKWFRFIIAKIYNILRYVIARILRHICVILHIKGTEISQKRSKGIKNWKITYSVILSVLSNKTNLNLGFSSPLNSVLIYRHKFHLIPGSIVNIVVAVCGSILGLVICFFGHRIYQLCECLNIAIASCLSFFPSFSNRPSLYIVRWNMSYVWVN